MAPFDLYSQRTAHGFHHLLGDRQAYLWAPVAMPGRPVGPHELSGKARLDVRGDTVAGVSHLKANSIPGDRPHSQFHEPHLGEFHRVLDQIEQRLAESSASGSVRIPP